MKLYFVNNGVYHWCGATEHYSLLFSEYVSDKSYLICMRQYSFKPCKPCNIKFPEFLSIGCSLESTKNECSPTGQYIILGDSYCKEYHNYLEQFAIEIQDV